MPKNILTTPLTGSIFLPGRLQQALGRWSFGPGVRERCWKKIGRQMQYTKLPLEHCFALLQRRAREEKSPLAHVYGRIQQALNEGHSVGQALAPFAAPEEVLLIDAGQTAGEAALAQGFLRAAELMERRRTLKATILKELSYPVFLLLAVCAFLVVIATGIVPRLAVLSNPATWTGASAALYALASFVTSWQAVVLAAGLVLTGVALALVLPHWTGRVRLWADKLPPFSLYRILSGVSWLYATAILMQAREMKLGVIIGRLLATKESSRYLRWRLGPVLEAHNRGLSLGDALHSTKDKWPDRTMVDDLRTYSTLPNFQTMLPGIAEELLATTTERVQRGSRIFGALALVGIVVLLLLLVMGIFGIQEQITRAVGRVGGL